MKRVTFAVLGLMVLVGCARAAMPIRLNPAAGTTEVPCIDRLLAKSRMTGYIEQTVDKGAGFFRVGTRSTGNKGRMNWLNVQCMPDGSAVITPVGKATGALTEDRGVKINRQQERELNDYAAQLDNF